MSELSTFSFKTANFKCFGEQEQGFDEIKPINVIIGRNNSGKSTLLDLLQYTIQGSSGQTKDLQIPERYYRNGKESKFVVRTAMREPILRTVFRENSSGGEIGGNHWRFGKQFVGKMAEFSLIDKDTIGFSRLFLTPSEDFSERDVTIFMNKASSHLKIPFPFSNNIFRRMMSDRHIAAEGDNPGNLDISGNGVGATNIIQNYLNSEDLDSDLIEVQLLSDLNTIFGEDAMFERILCQINRSTNVWEVYLDEKSKGRIALSLSGSGLQTVILVLLFTMVLPEILKKSINNLLFGFEELENNLHPALLRRLLDYISSVSLNKKCTFFLTTHSNVMIDFFSTKDQAQIIHVTHNREESQCKIAHTFFENMIVLEDLEIRASDLLQSNSIIWVEGPSDRAYFNQWIKIHTNGELLEGRQYQCLSYGGKLLSHLSAADPDEIQSAVNILLINHNSVVIMDSDRKNKTDKSNRTKNRIKRQVEEAGGIAWITNGREIENYLHYKAIELWLSDGPQEQMAQFDSFPDYLSRVSDGLGEKYTKKKYHYATEIVEHITDDDALDVLDLKSNIKKISNKIRSWNGLPEG